MRFIDKAKVLLRTGVGQTREQQERCSTKMHDLELEKGSHPHNYSRVRTASSEHHD